MFDLFRYSDIQILTETRYYEKFESLHVKHDEIFETYEEQLKNTEN